MRTKRHGKLNSGDGSSDGQDESEYSTAEISCTEISVTEYEDSFSASEQSTVDGEIAETPPDYARRVHVETIREEGQEGEGSLVDSHTILGEAEATAVAAVPEETVTEAEPPTVEAIKEQNEEEVAKEDGHKEEHVAKYGEDPALVHELVSQVMQSVTQSSSSSELISAKSDNITESHQDSESNTATTTTTTDTTSTITTTTSVTTITTTTTASPTTVTTPNTTETTAIATATETLKTVATTTTPSTTTTDTTAVAATASPAVSPSTSHSELSRKDTKRERGNRSERGDKSDRGEKSERGDKSERGGDKSERSDRGDKGEKGDKSERGGEKGDSTDKTDVEESKGSEKTPRKRTEDRVERVSTPKTPRGQIPEPVVLVTTGTPHVSPVSARRSQHLLLQQMQEVDGTVATEEAPEGVEATDASEGSSSRGASRERPSSSQSPTPVFPITTSKRLRKKAKKRDGDAGRVRNTWDGRLSGYKENQDEGEASGDVENEYLRSLVKALHSGQELSATLQEVLTCVLKDRPILIPDSDGPASPRRPSREPHATSPTTTTVHQQQHPSPQEIQQQRQRKVAQMLGTSSALAFSTPLSKNPCSLADKKECLDCSGSDSESNGTGFFFFQSFFFFCVSLV